MIAVEGQDERLKAELKHNNFKMWIAIVAALISAITAIVTAFIGVP